jgi:hypothetical protein
MKNVCKIVALTSKYKHYCILTEELQKLKERFPSTFSTRYLPTNYQAYKAIE